jgi:hypothetical protein
VDVRSESKVSGATRHSNSRLLGIGEMGSVEQPHPSTGDVRDSGPDLLAVTVERRLGLGRRWPEILPQDDNGQKAVSKRYRIDADTMNSRPQPSGHHGIVQRGPQSNVKFV